MGGLVFIGATNDSRFRAFDKESGKELWTTRLPASAHATSATYLGKKSGKRFVVIAAGGRKQIQRHVFPRQDQCLVCHKRDGDGRAGLPGVVLDHIPSQRLYNLPDSVFFSHAKHGAAKVQCKSCHGDVAARDVLQVKLPLTMKNCVDCHRANRAAITCTTCHELGQ